ARPEGLGASACLAGQLPVAVRVAEQRRHRGRDRLRIFWVDEDGALAGELAHRIAVRGDHRDAERGRLEDGHAKAFTEGRVYQSRGGAIELEQLVLGDVGPDAHAVRGPAAVEPALGADEDQLTRRL